MERFRRGFTLVELLVVIGIIAVLVSLLMPAFSKVWKQSRQSVCASNLKQLYVSLQIYSTENRGWLFPVGPDGANGKPTTFGTNYMPHERWPMRVKGMGAARPPTTAVTYTDPTNGQTKEYTPLEYSLFSEERQKQIFDATPWTSRVLICPQDQEAVEAHSYVLNHHLADERIRFGTPRKGRAGSTSNIVIAGEKQTDSRDYYMENLDFDRVVEEQRHGIKLGSNYLYMDSHVENRPPKTVAKDLDPWANVVTTTPDTPTNPTP